MDDFEYNTELVELAVLACRGLDGEERASTIEAWKRIKEQARLGAAVEAEVTQYQQELASAWAHDDDKANPIHFADRILKLTETK